MKPYIDTEKKNFRAGYVSIFGKPNVGKSTLLNQLLGIKLSIVSPKPQTTRHRIIGIHSSAEAQIIFIDTPGMLTPRYYLQKAMMKAVHAAIADADILLFMVEAGESLQVRDAGYLQQIMETQKPVLVVVNKIDRVKKQNILPLIGEIGKNFAPEAIIPISALQADGLDLLITEIIRKLPLSPPYYPPEMLTEHPERFFVAEIIREQIFYQFSEEIPYSTTVVIDEYHEQKGRKDVIRATIIAERESQKGILIGKKGAALKKIGAAARKAIEVFLNRPVYLELWVKVREKWRKSDSAVREYGYGAQNPGN